MNTSFTPGQWSVGTYLNNDALTVEDCHDGEECIVAMVMPSFIGSDMVNHQEANARLIAAAPAMYAALQEVLADYDSDESNIGETEYSWIQAARAAINLATGQEP
jgi:hypothetical protein